jgi:hypothetical protein
MDDLALGLRRYSPTYCLVIINGKTSDNQQIDALLDQGQLIDWRLPRARLNQELSEFLRQKENWPENETHWALFHNNKLLAHGPGLPGQAALIQELEWSGLQPPANALRRFVSANPSHLTAKEMFVGELKRVAELKTREKLGSEAGTNAERVLPDEDDQAIWGEYARLYRQTFQYFIEQGRPQWTWEADGPWNSSLFMHSQTMKLLARSFLPTLEAALKRQPTDDFLWGAWAALSDLNENISIKGFTETLVLSPFDSSEVPPYNARSSLLKRYRSKSNWPGVMELQEGYWKTTRYFLEQNPTLWRQYYWKSEILHLLEAYLRLDKTVDANELVTIWSQSGDWQQIKQSAVELAEKCGKDNLAGQWGKL